jgi:hypothetical protein
MVIFTLNHKAMNNFKNLGYYKDLFALDNKYLGQIDSIKDNEEIGYYSRKKNIANEDIIMKNGKKIKKGQEYISELRQYFGEYINQNSTI